MAFVERNIRAKVLRDEGGEFWDRVAFAVDTAGSWEGSFPEPARGDYLVTVGSIDSESEPVLVSRRYTSPSGAGEAADLALSAYAERRGYATDDRGDLLPVPDHRGEGTPAWVEVVEKVV